MMTDLQAGDPDAGTGLFAPAKDLAEQAHIYEEIGDPAGLDVGADRLAYAHVADPTAQGMAGRIEHVGPASQPKGEITESQSAVDEAQGSSPSPPTPDSTSSQARPAART